MIRNQLQIGTYRPIYYWAGPGTIRMNQLKFMDQPVDHSAHLEAHQQIGAERIVDQVYSNWIHLTYDWGFPPEVEFEDWASFQYAAENFHARGAKVFAYIQSSNCVFSGSYRDKDWYAVDPRGRKIHYYTNRYMTCLLNPDWRLHLKDMIAGAIDRGADGIFLDNLWFGAMPFSMMKTWLGPVGCHDAHCSRQYHQASGGSLPKSMEAPSEVIGSYLRWRADQVTGLMREMGEYARKLKADVVMGANDFDTVMRDAYLIYGLDQEGLACVQDVCMIENYSLPEWRAVDKRALVNNAITIKTAASQIHDRAHLSIISYATGIGFDDVYSPRQYQRTIAEAAACGGSNTIKGTEYYHQGAHTVLSAESFMAEREAIGRYQRWLAAHSGIYSESGENLAKVALLLPEDELRLDWHRTAPLYFGVCQTLLFSGIPWKVVRSEDQIGESHYLLSLSQSKFDTAPNQSRVKMIHVPSLPGWSRPESSFLQQHPVIRRFVAFVEDALMRGYFQSRILRLVFDRLGLIRLFTGCEYFRIPPDSMRKVLLDRLRGCQLIEVENAPVLVEDLLRDGCRMIHLVNYGEGPQLVTVNLDHAVEARVISPEQSDVIISGKCLKIRLDIYSIIMINEHEIR